MATGYTASILEGCSFPEFIWRCAKAFGANISMRDEASDKRVMRYTVNSFHRECVFRAEKGLALFEAMDMNEARRRFENLKRKYRAHLEQRNAEWRKKLLLYKKMRACVVEWTPPSPDHDGLKDFMIKQIDESIAHDCVELSPADDGDTCETAEDWLKSEIAEYRTDIEYHTSQHLANVEHVAKLNTWNDLLVASVPQP